MKSMEEKAIEIAKLMEDGKGNDVTLLDISGLNSWTDYFVIVTVTSSTHWQGLYKQIKEYIKDNDLEIHVTNRKSPDGRACINRLKNTSRIMILKSTLQTARALMATTGTLLILVQLLYILCLKVHAVSMILRNSGMPERLSIFTRKKTSRLILESRLA